MSENDRDQLDREQYRVVTIPMDAETAEQVRRDLVDMGVKPDVARVEEVQQDDE